MTRMVTNIVKASGALRRIGHKDALRPLCYDLYFASTSPACQTMSSYLPTSSHKSIASAQNSALTYSGVKRPYWERRKQIGECMGHSLVYKSDLTVCPWL